MKTSDIKGIIPPVITPMNNDDEQTVNHEALRQQVERLLAGGVHGMFPLGTNGEAYALSFKEKEEILATVIDQVKGRVPVYAGTGCITTAETIRMSRRAEEMGADALSIITPSFALASQKELYDHYVAVAKAVNLPIILYNIPARTGNKLLPETVQALCRDVENIVGAKDSSGDIENLKAYIRLTRELDKEVAILAGNDGAILTCLKEGGAGGIAGRANIWPATVAKIYDCFKAGDLEGAQAAQDAIAILQQTFKYGNPNTIIKTAVALQGHSSLDDGVGVAVLEGLLQDGDRVLSGLCALEVASLEAVVDLCNSGRPDVGAACNAACAALFQAGQDGAVVTGQNGNFLIQLAGQADVGLQVLDIAAGILCAHDVLHVTAQCLHGLGQQLVAGAGGDVVQDDGQVHGLCHGHIVVVQLLLGGQCEAGGDDGQGICAHLLGAPAHADGLGGGDAAGACVNGDAALDLVDDGSQDLFLLLKRESVSLAVGAQREHAVDAACQQTLDLLTQSLVVDGLLVIVVHGGNYRRDNAFDVAGLHNVFSFSIT